MALAYVLGLIVGNVDSWPLKPKPGLNAQACHTGWNKLMLARKELRHHVVWIVLTILVMAEQAVGPGKPWGDQRNPIGSIPMLIDFSRLHLVS